MNNEYKLSGNSGNIFIVGLLIGPILAMLLCIIYAYINVYNPYIYFTFLVFIGLLIGVVIIQKIVVKLAKCRSTNSSVIYGLIVGLFGIYANWCTFLYVMFRKENIPIELIDLLINPYGIYELANLLSIDGHYTLFKIDVKGGVLWSIWVIEGIGILGAGALGGLTVMHEEIFCEDCNRWAEDLNFDLRLAIEDKVETKKLIESDINKILDFPLYESDNSEHLKVNLHQCSKCRNTSTVDIDLISYETNDKGEIKEKNEDFSKVYLLSNNQFIQFLNKKHQSIPY